MILRGVFSLKLRRCWPHVTAPVRDAYEANHAETLPCFLERRPLEPVAAAGDGHKEIQLRVHRMAALFQQIFRRFFVAANLHQFFLFLRMVLPEMLTEPALAIMNCRCHKYLAVMLFQLVH